MTTGSDCKSSQSDIQETVFSFRGDDPQHDLNAAQFALKDYQNTSIDYILKKPTISTTIQKCAQNNYLSYLQQKPSCFCATHPKSSFCCNASGPRTWESIKTYIASFTATAATQFA